MSWIINCKFMFYCYVRTRLGGLDSLIRLLLGVELAQSHMIQLMMNKLMDCSSEFTISSRYSTVCT